MESFDPATADPVDVDAWNMIFVAGQNELSGAGPVPEDVAARVRVGRARQVWRWVARVAEGEPVVGAALTGTSGEVVAATVGTVTGGPVADQHDTAVMVAHRRKGGVAGRAKATQALRIHDLFPHVEASSVTIDVENAAMPAVNRSLRYRRVAERLLVEECLR